MMMKNHSLSEVSIVIISSKMRLSGLKYQLVFHEEKTSS
jgi:hypothetical protein